MRKNQSSLTALGIAVMRAVESEKPAGERVCYDPYARRFVPGWMYFLLRFFIQSGYTEWRGPGVGGWLAARDRYIDDLLCRWLEEGLEQLVILGAGYDSRAYRFHYPPETRIFEVDHPATQAEKVEKVRQFFASLPANIRFVSVDFNNQSLAERLLDCGYDPARKTLFIWQGVTMYLSAQAVDETLRFAARQSAPGSAVVFDYVYRSLLEGTQPNAEIGNMRRYRFMTGEGLSFGIPEGTAADFLRERGFRQALDTGAEGLRQAYFQGKNAWRKIAGGYGIAIGVV